MNRVYLPPVPPSPFLPQVAVFASGPAHISRTPAFLSKGSPNTAVLSPHPSQVSLAVLLENFLEASNELEAREERERIVRAEREQQVKNPLEPLLLKLTKEFSDDQDLSDRLQRLYEVASVSSYFCSLLSVAA